MVFTFIPRHQKVLMLTLKKMTDKQSNPSYVGVQELAQTLHGSTQSWEYFWAELCFGVFVTIPDPSKLPGVETLMDSFICDFVSSCLFLYLLLLSVQLFPLYFIRSWVMGHGWWVMTLILTTGFFFY